MPNISLNATSVRGEAKKFKVVETTEGWRLWFQYEISVNLNEKSSSANLSFGQVPHERLHDRGEGAGDGVFYSPGVIRDTNTLHLLAGLRTINSLLITNLENKSFTPFILKTNLRLSAMT